jgi:hypothetical protein
MVPEMLSGKPIFPGDTDLDTLYRILIVIQRSVPEILIKLMSNNFEKLGMGIDLNIDEYEADVVENVNNLNSLINIIADN